MDKRLLLHLILILTLIAGLLGSTSTAHAATGCTMYINATHDGNNADGHLTLREAIQIANAGTDALGLNRPLTNSEYSQMTGCAWNADKRLISGGAGYADTIRFDNILGLNPTLTYLLEPIGFVDDSGDVLDGMYSNIYPTIDASTAAANFGLVLGNNVTVKGVRVTSTGSLGIDVAGNGNTLINVAVWKAGEAGIWIGGDNNTVDGAVIGVASTNTTTCGSDGNSFAGIEISTGYGVTSAKHNVIKNSTINCNGTAGTYPGILITGSGADYNTIGPNNLIGTNPSGIRWALPNSGDGVEISAGADYTKILDSAIANNEGHGVSIANASQTEIGGSQIRFNSLDGINLSGSTDYTTIGGPSFGSNLTGNVIGSNGHHGINLVGSNVLNTLVAGNEIGTLNGGTTDVGNNYNGVMINGARNNIIGDEYAALNIIGGNQLIGVLLNNGASGNAIGHNQIGTQQAPNLFYGVQLDTGAHDNVIGTDVLTITHNALGNVLIQGSTTATNTVKNLQVHSSPGFGIALRNGTFNNAIGQAGAQIPNTISSNQGQGIEISGGAHDNDVFGPWIVQNGRNGIRLTGAGTTGNSIQGGAYLANGYDGLSEGNGATGNSWSAIWAMGNGGLSVDKSADSETTDEVNPSAATIQSSVLVNDVITATGTAAPGNLFTAVKVEAYTIHINSLGHMDLDYVGSSPVSITGTWTITKLDHFLSTPCVVVIQTTTNTLMGITRNSSEPSYSNCRVLLPAVVK